MTVSPTARLRVPYVAFVSAFWTGYVSLTRGSSIPPPALTVAD